MLYIIKNKRKYIIEDLLELDEYYTETRFHRYFWNRQINDNFIDRFGKLILKAIFTARSVFDS